MEHAPTPRKVSAAKNIVPMGEEIEMPVRETVTRKESAVFPSAESMDEVPIPTKYVPTSNIFGSSDDVIQPYHSSTRIFHQPGISRLIMI